MPLKTVLLSSTYSYDLSAFATKTGRIALRRAKSATETYLPAVYEQQLTPPPPAEGK
jgi:hypothetical protein